MLKPVNSKPVISESSKVTFHFSLALENGDIIDSTFDKSPATFVFGDGNLPPGFADLLIGLSEGDRQSFTVPPEKAFGQRNPNNIQVIPVSKFPKDMTLEKGLMLSFADAARGELPGVVTSIEGDSAQVDFNHPLAGRELTFQVEILAVEDDKADKT
ncbi:MAG: peptidylprolyl isomerase [Proteobacteria bacterium]|nr:MAG: peptidylprolyl isomerase [Pseudomonadota bacterium]